MMSRTDAPEDRGALEIHDPAAYREGIPYATFAALRESTPVSWHEEPPLPPFPTGSGFWAVTRYDDVKHVLRSTDVFSSWLGGTSLPDTRPGELDRVRTMLINQDPPQHAVRRRILGQALTREALAAHDRFIGEYAAELVADIHDEGAADIVGRVTDELALGTLARLLGLPDSDRPLFFRWANEVAGRRDDEEVDGEIKDYWPELIAEMFAYADEVAEFKRRHPGDDLMSALVHARVDGEELSADAIHSDFWLLIVAGNETSRGALPGALMALMDNPDQLAALGREPEELLPGAVEECLRYAPPVIRFRRTATRDTELHGVQIRADDKVVVFHPAANRDPRAFDDPDAFDIRRRANSHVSFGYGPHACVGAGLARMQLRHFLREAATQLPGLHPTEPPELHPSNFFFSPIRQPVAWS
jgi:cytochrome P450